MGEHLKNALSFKAASAMSPHQAVLPVATAQRTVIAASALTQEPHGVTGDASAAAGEAVVVYGRGAVVEVTAGASLGAGADVAVAPASQPLVVPVAGASGSVRFRIGKALEPADAGERFSLYVDPAKLSGAA